MWSSKRLPQALSCRGSRRESVWSFAAYQFPLQNKASNSSLVLQELTLSRICPKCVEARLRGPEPAWPRYPSTYLVCPVGSLIGLNPTFPISGCGCPKNPPSCHDGDGSGIHERNQLSHRAHKTISRCRELASARQRRRLSARLHTLQLIQAHSSPLAILVTSDDPKDTPYLGAAWSPPIRSSTCRNTSRGTAPSAS